MGLDDVLSDLERIGYTCQPFVIPACAVDAKHRRDRIWILANTTSERQQGSGSHGDEVSPTKGKNRKATIPGDGSERTEWSIEPALGRVANGIPNRLDRLKGLGNAIVPQVAAEILRCMMASDKSS